MRLPRNRKRAYSLDGEIQCTGAAYCAIARDSAPLNGEKFSAPGGLLRP
jgi:hypothetical protein